MIADTSIAATKSDLISFLHRFDIAVPLQSEGSILATSKDGRYVAALYPRNARKAQSVGRNSLRIAPYGFTETSGALRLSPNAPLYDQNYSNSS
jgi:hypothetical protein